MFNFSLFSSKQKWNDFLSQHLDFSIYEQQLGGKQKQPEKCWYWGCKKLFQHFQKRKNFFHSSFLLSRKFFSFNIFLLSHSLGGIHYHSLFIRTELTSYHLIRSENPLLIEESKKRDKSQFEIYLTVSTV